MNSHPDELEPEASRPEEAGTNQEVSDSELVTRSREGDTSAFGELWARHANSGRAAARAITSSIDPDDLVSEAYTRIWQAIVRGGGPNNGFRPYLLVTIRNVAARIGSRNKEIQIDWADQIPDDSTGEEAMLRGLDRGTTAQAFATLPPRWQEVLWYSEVEGYGPTEVGKLLGISSAAAAMLSFRAREGLRRAWVQAHITDTGSDPTHTWTIERLGAYSTNALRAQDRSRVEDHLRACPECEVLASEAQHVSSRLALVLIPLAVGVAGSVGYRMAIDDGTTRLLSDGQWLADRATFNTGTAAAANTAPIRMPATRPPVSLLAGTAAGVILTASLAGLTSSLSSDHDPSGKPSSTRDHSVTQPPEGDIPSAEEGSALQPPETPKHPAPDPIEVQTAQTVSGELTASADLGPSGVFFPLLFGTAPAGSDIVIRHDSLEIARVQTDSDGNWSTPQLDVASPTLTVELPEDPAANLVVQTNAQSPTIRSAAAVAGSVQIDVSGAAGAHFEIRDDAGSHLVASRLDPTGDWSSQYPADAVKRAVSVRYAAGDRSGPWMRANSYEDSRIGTQND
jgi:RNA polymerase sigma factor (sigma-70 family)